MSSAPDLELPQIIESKLRAVLRRKLMFRVVACVLCPATVLLAATMAAMALDWIFELPGTKSRTAVSLLALSLALTSVLWMLARLLSLRRELSVAALDVERAVPALQERYSTIAELRESADPPAIKGAPALIEQVSNEAV